MMRLIRSLSPRRISGQIILLVLISVAITQVVNTLINAAHMASNEGELHLRDNLGTFTLAVPLIAELKGEERVALIAAINTQSPELELRLAGADEALPKLDAFAPPAPPGAMIPGLSGRPVPSALGFVGMQLGPGYKLAITEIAVADDADAYQRVFVALPDQSVLIAKLPTILWPKPPNGFFSTPGILLIILLPVVLIWTARALTTQLGDFARAAEEFSFEEPQAPLAERGPEEVRVATRAFNRMRERIAALVRDRTRMLSAVGHDLRTPVTRMRLRAEFIADEDARSGILRDIERMDAMIEATLTLLRDGAVATPGTNVDLDSLLRTVCSEFSDSGARVDYQGGGQITVSVTPDALTRALENLIQNSLNFGQTTRVRLLTGADNLAIIDVDDDGPGIAEADRASMLEPFVRGDKARGVANGGFGLGLSIANDVARASGGRLELRTSDLGGLRARITLPTV